MFKGGNVMSAPGECGHDTRQCAERPENAEASVRATAPGTAGDNNRPGAIARRAVLSRGAKLAYIVPAVIVALSTKEAFAFS
jgi:hypothetical protein